jgi:hypothetical protein
MALSAPDANGFPGPTGKSRSGLLRDANPSHAGQPPGNLVSMRFDPS